MQKPKNWIRSRWKRTDPVSVGLVGNIGDVLEEMLHEGLIPDVLTDQTSAHDPLNGYVPAGISVEEAMSIEKERSGSIPAAIVEKHGTTCRIHARNEKTGQCCIRLWEQSQGICPAGR